MKRLSVNEKRALLAQYEAEGKMHVSPAEAAPLLDCAPYTINVTAKNGGYPSWAYRFHGCNCRVNIAWIACQISEVVNT